jgi:hypothetical protein
MTVGKQLLEWDTCAIAKHHAEYLRETRPELSEDEAFEAACQDYDIQQVEWEDLLERLGEVMEERNPRNVWYIEGRRMGWRAQDGWQVAAVESAKELLQKVLPNTDCTFKIYEYGGHGLAINNAHHDSPVWKEWYYLVPGLDESLIENALIEATDAVLLVDPELVCSDIEDGWDFYEGELNFLEGDEDDKVSPAALIVGGMAFRSCIARANVDTEIDLTPLWGDTIEDRCQTVVSLAEAWLAVDEHVRADFEEGIAHESIAILKSIIPLSTRAIGVAMGLIFALNQFVAAFKEVDSYAELEWAEETLFAQAEAAIEAAREFGIETERSDNA